MDSLATVLRRIPSFQGLPPGSFARIIADLREEQHAAGAVICYEGDAANDFRCDATTLRISGNARSVS